MSDKPSNPPSDKKEVMPNDTVRSASKGTAVTGAAHPVNNAENPPSDVERARACAVDLIASDFALKAEKHYHDLRWLAHYFAEKMTAQITEVTRALQVEVAEARLSAANWKVAHDQRQIETQDDAILVGELREKLQAAERALAERFCPYCGGGMECLACGPENRRLWKALDRANEDLRHMRELEVALAETRQQAAEEAAKIAETVTCQKKCNDPDCPILEAGRIIGAEIRAHFSKLMPQEKK
jgi:hypothetical protein